MLREIVLKYEAFLSRNKLVAKVCGGHWLQEISSEKDGQNNGADKSDHPGKKHAEEEQKDRNS